jgi:hypothetical protein
MSYLHFHLQSYMATARVIRSNSNTRGFRLFSKDGKGILMALPLAVQRGIASFLAGKFGL